MFTLSQVSGSSVLQPDRSADKSAGAYVQSYFNPTSILLQCTILLRIYIYFYIINIWLN